MTRLLFAILAGIAAFALRRAYLMLQGHLFVIEESVDEAVARMRALTVQSADTYESTHFARVSAGARERLEAATAGASDPRLN